MEFRLLHIVGARPQFAKAAAVSRGLRKLAGGGYPCEERLLHTGQHYDHGMSAVFFEELELRQPDYNLETGSGTLGYQVAASLEGISQVLGDWHPDCVVVYGDTNATMAGAVAAVQQHLPLAHVEAGVRTGNLHQVEELNRVVTDRISTWRFCCTGLNMRNLEDENLAAGSFLSGDTMLDNYLHFLPRMANDKVENLGLRRNGFILCTAHRAENTDHADRLNSILDALIATQREIMPVVLPLHPRTRLAIDKLGRSGELEAAGVRVLEPIGFTDTQALLENCHCVLSDSGGILREAYFAGRFCVIPWEYAAWPELVEAGWANAGPVSTRELVERISAAPEPRPRPTGGIFGSGNAGLSVAQTICENLQSFMG